MDRITKGKEAVFTRCPAHQSKAAEMDDPAEALVGESAAVQYRTANVRSFVEDTSSLVTPRCERSVKALGPVIVMNHR